MTWPSRILKKFWPASERSLRGQPSAVAVLVRELYRIGAMNTGEYSNDSFVGQVHRSPDPVQKERIKQLVQQAQKLEEAELARNPNNVDMLYARALRAPSSLPIPA